MKNEKNISREQGEGNDNLNIMKILETEPVLYNFMRQCPYEILRQIKVWEYAKGEFVLSQGEIYEDLYIVVSGELDIIVDSEHGKKYILNTYKKGSLIGELEMLKKRPYVSRVEAKTQVKLLIVPREVCLKWLKMDQVFNEFLMRELMDEAYEMCLRMGNTTLYSLKRRICQFLLDGVVDTDHEDGYKIQMDSETLSGIMAVTQRSVNRVLKTLKEKKIIEVSKKCIHVLDYDALSDELDK